jgi:predicted nucleotidyltransferase
VTRIDIQPHDLEAVIAILRRRVPDRLVRAFGSRATGKAKPFSDLDLAVMGEVPLPTEVLARLADDFDESSLPFKVDVVDWASASDTFRRIIDRQAVEIKPAGRGSA